MSLQLQLLQIKGISSDKSTIFVQGSQAGELVVHKKSTSYKVKCNKFNILKFTIKIDGNDQKKGLLQAQFSAQRFLRENKTNPELYKQGTKIDHQINILDGEQRIVGTLKFGIIYIKGQIFMGEKFGNFETLPQKQPVRIFEGACQTRNLFNFLDHGYEDTNFHLLENNYRDGTSD